MYAQVRNGFIENVIVLEDESIAPHFKGDFNHIVRIDNLELVPGIGWGYDGEKFTAPIRSEE